MAPGKGALTTDTEESATVPSATVQVQVDSGTLLAPWVMATEISTVPWVTITKDSSYRQDMVMER
jgi:hypothetical protein